MPNAPHNPLSGAPTKSSTNEDIIAQSEALFQSPSGDDSKNLDGLFEEEFNRLIASFEAIIRIKSPLRRRFTLAKTAKWHGIPAAEHRLLFDLYLAEFAVNGGER